MYTFCQLTKKLCTLNINIGSTKRNRLVRREADRISDRLSVRLKYTANYFNEVSYVDAREYGEIVSGDPTPDVNRAASENYNAFRLQLDYSW